MAVSISRRILLSKALHRRLSAATLRHKTAARLPPQFYQRISGVRSIPLRSRGAGSTRPDALIHFDLSESGRFRISLEFDNSRGLATQAKRRLESDPIVYWRSLRAELERLPTGDPLRELERISGRLYQEGWPAALIPAMEELLASDARTVQVCFSHRWLIPWELLRPYGLSAAPRSRKAFSASASTWPSGTFRRRPFGPPCVSSRGLRRLRPGAGTVPVILEVRRGWICCSWGAVSRLRYG